MGSVGDLAWILGVWIPSGWVIIIIIIIIWVSKKKEKNTNTNKRLGDYKNRIVS